ncbi:MAG: PHP domain-containing protein [Spirochaetia bacterium]
MKRITVFVGSCRKNGNTANTVSLLEEVITGKCESVIDRTKGNYSRRGRKNPLQNFLIIESYQQFPVYSLFGTGMHYNMTYHNTACRIGRNMELFTTDAWFKGNLHMHTTVSDGVLDKETAVEKYRKEKYDFLAITDHSIFTPETNDRDMLLLSGIEYICDQYHVVGIGMTEPPPEEQNQSVDECIEDIIRREGIPIIAHPVWSLLDHQDMFRLSGNVGTEVWNSVCHFQTRRGDASSFLDVLFAGGLTPPIFAVDDTHHYKKELFSGWIMVNCQKCERELILEAITEKRFYCTQGPAFEQIWVEGDTVRVKTSPVSEIRFMSARFSAPGRMQRGKGITDAVYTINPDDVFLRIELEDSKGKRAWSQIIWESIL